MNNEESVPYVCGITGELMREPVRAADQYYYDGPAFTQHVTRHLLQAPGTPVPSPKTGKPLTNTTATPAPELKKRIEEFHTLFDSEDASQSSSTSFLIEQLGSPDTSQNSEELTPKPILEQLTEAIEQEPENVMHWVTRAKYYKQEGQVALALRDYMDMVKVAHESLMPIALQLRAEFLREIGLLTQAIDDLETASHFLPDDLILRERILRVKEEQEEAADTNNESVTNIWPADSAEAAAMNDTLTELSREDLTGENFLKEMEDRTADFAMRFEDFDGSFDNNALEPDALYQAGIVALQMAQFEQAITTFNKLLQQEPNNQMYLQALRGAKELLGFTLQTTAEYEQDGTFVLEDEDEVVSETNTKQAYQM